MVHPPDMSIGSKPDVFADIIVWNQSIGYYDIRLEAMVYPEGLYIGWAPAIHNNKIVWAHSAVYYDIDLQEAMFLYSKWSGYTGAPEHPDIFENIIVGHNYDAVPPISHVILMWDPVCKISRVSESEIAYAAKIYNETVVWMDERNGNADIYMAKIPEACCGDPDHTYPVGDLNQDCRVDLLDLAIFASHWLEDNRPNGVITTIYQFQPDPNALTTSGGIHGGGCGTFSVAGCFQLNVDPNVGTAFFKQVDATISDEIHFFDYDGEHITDSLGVLFNMTKLFSTDINDIEIEFVFEKNVPSFPLADVSMKVTFLDGTDHTVRLVGSFCEPVYDGFCYHLDAVAVAASDQN